MKRRKTALEMADGSHTGNVPLGAESSGEAPPLENAEVRLHEPTNGSDTVEPHLQAEVPPPPEPPDETRTQIEERLRRLEVALARLHELNDQPPPTPPPPPMALVAPVAQIVPPPSPIMTAPTEAANSFLFHVGKQMLATTPLSAVAQPTYPAQESTFGAGLRWTWLFFDAYAELRAIARMFVDPRYQMSWTSRLVPLALAALLFTSSYWAPGTTIPGIGTLIDKVIDLPLAFLFFKILSHEARRYRQLSPDLPAALRLPPDR